LKRKRNKKGRGKERREERLFVSVPLGLSVILFISLCHDAHHKMTLRPAAEF